MRVAAGNAISVTIATALLLLLATAPAKSDNCFRSSGLPDGECDTVGMVFIPGGAFRMGSDRYRPEERHVHSVRIDGFWIDKHVVTNAQFREFVEVTGYVTLAERGLDPKANPGLPKELLAAGSVVFTKPTAVRHSGCLTQWRRYIKGADWKHPAGPGGVPERGTCRI